MSFTATDIAVPTIYNYWVLVVVFFLLVVDDVFSFSKEGYFLSVCIVFIFR